VIKNILMAAAIIILILSLGTSFNSKVDSVAFACVKTTVDSLRASVQEIDIRNEYRDKDVKNIFAELKALIKK